MLAIAQNTNFKDVAIFNTGTQYALAGNEGAEKWSFTTDSVFSTGTTQQTDWYPVVSYDGNFGSTSAVWNLFQFLTHPHVLTTGIAAPKAADNSQAGGIDHAGSNPTSIVNSALRGATTSTAYGTGVIPADGASGGNNKIEVSGNIYTVTDMVTITGNRTGGLLVGDVLTATLSTTANLNQKYLVTAVNSDTSFVMEPLGNITQADQSATSDDDITFAIAQYNAIGGPNSLSTSTLAAGESEGLDEVKIVVQKIKAKCEAAIQKITSSLAVTEKNIKVQENVLNMKLKETANEVINNLIVALEGQSKKTHLYSAILDL